MFRLFTTLIKAIFDHDDYLVLDNKCFVFLRRALRKCLITMLSYIREQMFRRFTARINAMFDNYVILY